MLSFKPSQTPPTSIQEPNPSLVICLKQAGLFYFWTIWILLFAFNSPISMLSSYPTCFHSVQAFLRVQLEWCNVRIIKGKSPYGTLITNLIKFKQQIMYPFYSFNLQVLHNFCISTITWSICTKMDISYCGWPHKLEFKSYSCGSWVNSLYCFLFFLFLEEIMILI